MRKLIVLGSLSYLLLGLGHVMFGALLIELLAYYGRNYSEAGILVFTQFGGFLVGVLMMPIWSSRWGRRALLVISLGAVALAETVLFMMPPWYWIVALVFVMGYGFGSIESSVGSLVIDAAGEAKAVAMSRLEVFFGIGALIMPVVAGLFIRYEIWAYAFGFLGCTALVLLFGWARISFGLSIDERLRSKTSGQEVASNPSAPPVQPARQFAVIRLNRKLMMVFILIFMVYVGLEVSLIHFVPSIMVERMQVSGETASIAMTLFWVTMTMGRMVCGHVAERMGYLRYLLMSGGAAIVCLAAFLAINSLPLAYIVMAAVGLWLSGMFSITLVCANTLVKSTTEKTTSTLVASAGIGGALLPLFTGYVMEVMNAEAGAGWLLVQSIGLTLLLVWVRRIEVKAKHVTSEV